MILESIFRGNLSAVDLVYPDDPEYKRLNQEIVALCDQLSSTLTPENREILNQIINKIYSAQLIETESYFTFGFSMGMELHKEVSSLLNILK